MEKRELTSIWFKELRDLICSEFELIEEEFAIAKNLNPAKFERKKWEREGGGVGLS